MNQRHTQVRTCRVKIDLSKECQQPASVIPLSCLASAPPEGVLSGTRAGGGNRTRAHDEREKRPGRLAYVVPPVPREEDRARLSGAAASVRRRRSKEGATRA